MPTRSPGCARRPRSAEPLHLSDRCAGEYGAHRRLQRLAGRGEGLRDESPVIGLAGLRLGLGRLGLGLAESAWTVAVPGVAAFPLPLPLSAKAWLADTAPAPSSASVASEMPTRRGRFGLVLSCSRTLLMNFLVSSSFAWFALGRRSGGPGGHVVRASPR